LNLEIFDKTDSSLWNDIINRSSNGTLYHTWEWLKILEKYSESKLYPLVYFDGDDKKPFSVIPVFYMKKLGLKMIFSPPPASYIPLGPVLVDKGYKQHKFELAYLEFETQINKFFNKIGANYVSMVTSTGLMDMRPFSWDHYQITPSYTYKIDLTQGEKAVWNNFSRTLKQNINHSLAKGIRITESNLEKSSDIDYVYNSLCDRYCEQHINLPLQKAYIQDVLKEFGNTSIKLVMATYENEPVGATIFTRYKDVISAWLGSVRYKTNYFEVNGCIYHGLIPSFIKEGCKWLEIMGANTPRLCEAKSRYSPQIDIQFMIKKSDLLGNIAEKVYILKKSDLLRELTEKAPMSKTFNN
jgi:hypothetical protein